MADNIWWFIFGIIVALMIIWFFQVSSPGFRRYIKEYTIRFHEKIIKGVDKVIKQHKKELKNLKEQGW